MAELRVGGGVGVGVGVGPQKMRLASMGYVYGVRGVGVIGVMTCVGSKRTCRVWVRDMGYEAGTCPPSS